ncbi:hypothetical protein [Xanthomonas campestris]|nr:hypothetical protein [Xanthomonas campestris]
MNKVHLIIGLDVERLHDFEAIIFRNGQLAWDDLPPLSRTT